MMSTTVAIQITTMNTPRSHQNHAMRHSFRPFPGNQARARVGWSLHPVGVNGPNRSQPSSIRPNLLRSRRLFLLEESPQNLEEQMTRLVARLGVLALFAVLAAGCMGDDEDSSARRAAIGSSTPAAGDGS